MSEDNRPCECNELRAELQAVKFKTGILWKIVAFAVVTAVGAAGASLSAAKNSGDLEGSTRTAIESIQRDIMRHEQTLTYITMTMGHFVTSTNP